MRFAIDCRMWRSGGIGTYLRNVVPQLIASLPDLHFFLLGRSEDLKDIARNGNHQVKLVECTAPIYSIAEQFELARKIARCDLSFSPHYNIPLFYRGIQITTIHDIFHLAEENDDKSIVKQKYARTMLALALRKSRVVFTPSQFTLSEMKKYGLPCLAKVKVVHLGFNSATCDRAHPKTSEDKPFLLYVGNVKPHKNLRRLVAAYKRLHEHYHMTLPLVIVGEVDHFITGIPGFREEISESSWGRWITFTGRFDDKKLPDMYRNAGVLVLPSLYEGFGLPPLEAMSYGCPCVVSRAGAMPEICGNAAVYCDPYDPHDIADKIYHVVSDASLRQRLIKSGYERVRRFSWDNPVKAIMDVIEETSNRSRSSLILHRPSVEIEDRKNELIVS
ncbi:MAG: glycosyltransferase family 4 protein [Candidatus Zixiibacteriota bacterium]|nr:MAG: glycosyltransferase family 4 protein [candidate division Zixibacteria bacterium]